MVTVYTRNHGDFIIDVIALNKMKKNNRPKYNVDRSESTATVATAACAATAGRAEASTEATPACCVARSNSVLVYHPSHPAFYCNLLQL